MLCRDQSRGLFPALGGRFAVALVFGATLVALCVVHTSSPTGREESVRSVGSTGNVLSPSLSDETGRKVLAAGRTSHAHAGHAALAQALLKRSGSPLKAAVKDYSVHLSLKGKEKEKEREERDMKEDETAVEKASREAKRYDILTFSPATSSQSLSELPSPAAPNSAIAKAVADVLSKAANEAHQDEMALEKRLEKEEIHQYSHAAAAGIVRYTKDSSAEQEHDVERMAHSHHDETSGQLLSRYGKLAREGITDGDGSHAEATHANQAPESATAGAVTKDASSSEDEKVPQNGVNVVHTNVDHIAVTALSNTGHWRPATIIGKEPGGRYDVHFDGYESKYDEWISDPKRIRWGHAEQLVMRGASKQTQSISGAQQTTHTVPPATDSFIQTGGLASVCATCLIKTDLSSAARREACGVCLGARKSLAASCGECSGVPSEKLFFSLPFDVAEGGEDNLERQMCSADCKLCNDCITMSDEPCWSTCNNCSSCVANVLNMSGVTVYGSAISDTRSTQSLAHVQNCATTCGALAIVAGTSLAAAHRQEQARTMQLSDTLFGAGGGVAGALQRLSVKLHAASQLAGQLHANKIHDQVTRDEADLRKMEDQGRGSHLSAHTLHSMQRAASSLLKSLRQDVAQAALKQQLGAHKELASRRGARKEELSEAGHVTDPSHMAGSRHVVEMHQQHVEHAQQHALITPAVHPLRRAVQELTVGVARNSEPVQGMVPTPWSKPSATRAYASWSTPQCPLPDFPVIRAPLCSEAEIDRGTCTMVWGDIPEIVGAVVAMRVERRAALVGGQGTMYMDIIMRRRMEGDFPNASASYQLNETRIKRDAVSSNIWEGYGSQVASQYDLGVVKAHELGGGMIWNQDGVEIATSRQWSVLGALQRYPDTSVMDCSGRGIGVVRLEHVGRRSGGILENGATIGYILDDNGLVTMSIVVAGINLLDEELYKGVHLHVYHHEAGNLRLVGLLLKSSQDWSVKLENNGPLDPRVAVMLIGEFEVALSPPVKPSFDTFLKKIIPSSKWWKYVQFNVPHFGLSPHVWRSIMWAGASMLFALILLGLLCCLYAACSRPDCCDARGCWLCCCWPCLCCCPCWFRRHPEDTHKKEDGNKAPPSPHGSFPVLWHQPYIVEQHQKATEALQMLTSSWHHTEVEVQATKQYYEQRSSRDSSKHTTPHASMSASPVQSRGRSVPPMQMPAHEIQEGPTPTTPTAKALLEVAHQASAPVSPMLRGGVFSKPLSRNPSSSSLKPPSVHQRTAPTSPENTKEFSQMPLSRNSSSSSMKPPPVPKPKTTNPLSAAPASHAPSAASATPSHEMKSVVDFFTLLRPLEEPDERDSKFYMDSGAGSVPPPGSSYDGRQKIPMSKSLDTWSRGTPTRTQPSPPAAHKQEVGQNVGGASRQNSHESPYTAPLESVRASPASTRSQDWGRMESLVPPLPNENKSQGATAPAMRAEKEVPPYRIWPNIATGNVPHVKPFTGSAPPDHSHVWGQTPNGRWTWIPKFATPEQQPHQPTSLKEWSEKYNFDLPSGVEVDVETKDTLHTRAHTAR